MKSNAASTHAQANVAAQIVTITTHPEASVFAWLNISRPLPGGQSERLAEVSFTTAAAFDNFVAALRFVVDETNRQRRRDDSVK